MSKKDKDKDLTESIKAIGALLDENTKTIKTLTKAIPKVISREGATLCKLSELVFPDEKVLVLRFSPKTKRITIHVIADKLSHKNFENIMDNAKKIGKTMIDEDGMLTVSNHDKSVIEN